MRLSYFGIMYSYLGKMTANMNSRDVYLYENLNCDQFIYVFNIYVMLINVILICALGLFNISIWITLGLSPSQVCARDWLIINTSAFFTLRFIVSLLSRESRCREIILYFTWWKLSLYMIFKCSYKFGTWDVVIVT